MSGEFQIFSSMSPCSFSGRYTQLHEFLTARQLALLEKSDARRDRIDSIEKKQEYAKYMRETFIQKMGGIPKRDCPLNAKTVKTMDMGSSIPWKASSIPPETVCM